LTNVHNLHVSPINKEDANRLLFIVDVSDFNSRPNISLHLFDHPKGSDFRLCNWNWKRVFVQGVEAMNKRFDSGGNFLTEVNIEIAWRENVRKEKFDGFRRRIIVTERGNSFF